MVLKLGRFRQQIRNSWKVTKRGTGGGWRGTAGPNMCKMKKYYLKSRSRGKPCMK